MEKQKTTKRALLTSLLSLVLCCVMFIGTTYAWFTDSVTGANNKIVAGDLKLDFCVCILYHQCNLSEEHTYRGNL